MSTASESFGLSNWKNSQPDQPRFRIVFGLLALLAAILDLIVTWQLKHTTDPVSYRLLAYFTVFYLLDQSISQRRFASGPIALGCGSLLLGSVLCKALLISKGDDYYHLLPLLMGVSVALLTLGFREALRLWSVWIILFTISLFDNPFASLTISHLRLDDLGAWLSANVLLSVGYPAVAHQNLVLLPGGSVEVEGGCSSAQPLLYLLKLTLLALFVFRTSLWQKLTILSGAIVIALTGNAIRISVMAVLATAGDLVRFEYWHLGPGSNIFSTLYVCLFCGVCALCLRAGVSQSRDREKIAQPS